MIKRWVLQAIARRDTRFQVSRTGFSRKLANFSGLFLIAAGVLCIQLLQIRVLSVISWYFMAFFAISMAMLGMTAGSLFLHFNPKRFSSDVYFVRLAQLSMLFMLSIVLSWIMLTTTIVNLHSASLLMLFVTTLKLILAVLPPYVVGGLIIAVCLTRGPYPIGITYAVDLAGAGAGCFLFLGIMSVIDGVHALLFIAVIGGAAGLCFAIGQRLDKRGAARRRAAGSLLSPLVLTASIAVLTFVSAADYPSSIRLHSFKRAVDDVSSTDSVAWNSFSRVSFDTPRTVAPALSGPSPLYRREWTGVIRQRDLKIDGDASSMIFDFGGERSELAFLPYDVTTLAYAARQRGRAAVIGVGGGRDILSAWQAGFDDITGVELNPIIIDALTRRFKDQTKIAELAGVQLVVDEARSWFARTDQRFDVIQMSMIDTWAATGVGAYSLTENGLYTVEAWSIFLSKLNADGMFTVTRWYSPDDPGETGRLLSLAKASLFAIGVRDPNQHLYLAGTDYVATLVLSRAPLSKTDLKALDQRVERMAFVRLFGPGIDTSHPILQRVTAASSIADLSLPIEGTALDFSPATDARPFFFNQLKLSAVFNAVLGGNASSGEGVAHGNLLSSFALIAVIAISLFIALIVVAVPAAATIRQVPLGFGLLGSSYFLLIGAGFMLVEIGLMQRLSVFMGHPIYGVAIALAGIILSTGLGALLSDRLVLATSARLIVWGALTATYLASLPFWFPELVLALDSAGLFVRGAAALLIVMPAGLLMGYGFPTGMRLASSQYAVATPWFWAVNGAAGVFASGLAVAIGVFLSINATLWTGAAAYLLVVPVALLMRHSQRLAGAT